MSAGKQCPTCRFEIPAEAADGLCLRCLGHLGFSSEPGGLGDGAPLRLGDYDLLAEIARGGMGVVYRARQLSLNRIVALKVLLHGPFSSPDFVRRFRTEAQAVAALRHPNIVAIYEVGEQDGYHFLSLEFIDGPSFAEVARRGPLPAKRAAQHLKAIAEAVDHAHQRGVLHRDLKPSNILLDAVDQPRVTDFGLARLIDQQPGPTLSGQVLGSPNYMPPEQAGGKLASGTPQSDIYSLGAVLYEMITGRPPFQGETLQSVLAQVQGAEPVAPRRLNPGAPRDLQTICLKCLQKEPARRYASARELADDLGRFLEGKPIRARPVSTLERAWLWCRRRPLQATMSGALAASVLFGVAGIVWQWRQAEAHAQGELQQRLIAQREAAATRLNLYAADLALASKAMDSGNFGLARRTLQGLRPQAGETDLRGFEWRYLWHLCRGDQLATLTGHDRTVTSTAFSPDGSLLASGGMDGAVKIWSVSKREPITTLKVSSNAVWSVAFTADAQSLVTGCEGGVQFWDTQWWRVRTNFPGTLAALSKTGTFLATAESSPFYWEPAGAVTLWNWRTGQRLRRLDRPGRALALSPDGSLLAVAGTNSGILLWNTVDGQLADERPTPHSVWSLCFSPDGRELLSAGWSSEVAVWSLDGHAPPRTLPGHPLHVWSAVCSGDGATIATTSSDQTVRLWDAVTLEPKAVLHGHDNEVWCAAFSPDGNLLATGGKDQSVLLWSTATAHPANEFPHNLPARPLFSPDGKWLVTAGPARGDYSLWDADRHTLVAQNQADGGPVAGFSRDGKCVVTLDGDASRLRCWPPNGAVPPAEVVLQGRTRGQGKLAFLGMSPDQEFFFLIDEKGVIQVWNTTNGSLRSAIQGPVPPIRNAVMSPLANQIALSVDREDVARLYDCASGVEHKLAGHRDFISGLAFSADGRSLATGSMDGTIRLWNTATGRAVASLPGHLQETTDVAFSPDGRTLASLGRRESLKLWHLPTLREVVSQALPHAGMWLCFSPDGRKLAVETEDDRVRLLAAPGE